MATHTTMTVKTGQVHISHNEDHLNKTEMGANTPQDTHIYSHIIWGQLSQQLIYSACFWTVGRKLKLKPTTTWESTHTSHKKVFKSRDLTWDHITVRRQRLPLCQALRLTFQTD